MRVALLVSSLFLLASCATLQNAFRKPTLRFSNANVSAISLGGVTLDLAFEVDNPNPIALSLAEVEAALFVEDKQLVAGKPRDGLALRANSTSPLVFPAEIKFLDLASVIETFLTKDKAKYRLQGNVGVRTPIGIIRMPLSTEGLFDIPKVPKITFRAPKLRNITLTGATLDLPLTITNPNRLPLPIQKIAGALRIEGASLATIALDDIKTLAPNTPQEFTVPVTIRFAESLAAANALRQGKAKFELDGSISSGSANVPFRVQDLLSLVR